MLDTTTEASTEVRDLIVWLETLHEILTTFFHSLPDKANTNDTESDVLPMSFYIVGSAFEGTS